MFKAWLSIATKLLLALRAAEKNSTLYYICFCLKKQTTVKPFTERGGDHEGRRKRLGEIQEKTEIHAVKDDEIR